MLPNRFQRRLEQEAPPSPGQLTNTLVQRKGTLGEQFALFLANMQRTRGNVPLPPEAQAYGQQVQQQLQQRGQAAPNWRLNAPTAPPTPLLQRNSSGYYFGQPAPAGPPRPAFSGADVMRLLQGVGNVVQRGGATINELFPAPARPATQGERTLRPFVAPAGGVQPFFQRPKWWPIK